MGVKGVAPPGPGRSEPARIRTPLPRAGPDPLQRPKATQSVDRESRPRRNKASEFPEALEIAVLVKSGPRRAGTRLSVDAQTKRIVARIVDETNQTIKQIPPEELLKIVAQGRRIQAKLFDKTV